MHATHTASVVIPARDEAPTVGAVVEACARQPEVSEVVVVDDGSTDATAAVAAAAGALVVAASGGPGKGAAMRDGVAASSGEVIVFCDADLEDFDGSFVPLLVHALVDGGSTAGGLAMVKGDYERAGGGGRVTELAAKPIIRLLHPHVAHVAQPLGGEYAAWRSVLEPLAFVRGYGVDLGLLLDVAERHGAAAVGQVALGVRRHRGRSLEALGLEAEEVLAVALDRAGVGGVRPASCPPLSAAPSLPRPRRSA